ncbi:MAG: ribosomal RNA small subunit methyltransferase A [Actinomycetota bacterium]
MAGPRPRHRRPAPAGQHFFGRRTAADVVRRARLGAELVVEIGAGRGVLTHEIARRCARVLAVELDPQLTRRLRNRFDATSVVRIVQGDALCMTLPHEPFRAIGNVPFGITSALLRRLLAEGSMFRADLVVQEQVAVELTARRPRSLLALSAAPWWRFERGLRLPAHLFHPRPSVDASVLTLTRRELPLVEPSARARYLQLVRTAFGNAGAPLSRALAPIARSREIRGALREMGLDASTRAVDLGTEEFVALAAALGRRRISRGR